MKRGSLVLVLFLVAATSFEWDRAERFENRLAATKNLAQNLPVAIATLPDSSPSRR